MTSILGIGKSALLAAQVGIDVTGHNIANASTTGYSRQVLTQAALAGQNMGYGFVGKGTEVVAVNRVYNEYIATHLRTSQSSYSELSSYYTQIQQIDNMLADTTVGLSPSLQKFFTGIQDLATTPKSDVARQSLLSSAGTMVSTFQSLSEQLTEINQGLNSQIKGSVTNVNSYAKQIAQLNDSIEKVMGSVAGSVPNDLFDQRDQLLAELSKEIGVSVVKDGNSYDVYIGNGQPLVVGGNNYSLVATTSDTDPTRVALAYQNQNGTISMMNESSISGGNLAGLLEFRSETLDVAQNSLGRIATVLASTFNAQHSLGQDLNGDLGGNFFNVAAPLITASQNNTSTATVSGTIGNTALLTTSDYDLSFDGTNYTLMRLSDNTILSSTTLAAAQTAAATQGFDFTVTGTMNAGDNFSIRPTANGASGISVAVTETAKIAAAAPIIASASSSNTGTGTVTSGSVNNPMTVTEAILRGTVTITFNGNGTYNVAGTGAGLPATNVAYTAGSDITYNGWTFQISGSPAAGDTFTMASNTSGVGDNRNALLLSALQTTNLVNGSTATYQTAYSQLVNLIGNKTSELEVTSESAGTIYDNAYAAQQSESGVSLEEEAANLLRYQQAYQAAAQVMKIASEIFDSLLAIHA